MALQYFRGFPDFGRITINHETQGSHTPQGLPGTAGQGVFCLKLHLLRWRPIGNGGNHHKMKQSGFQESVSSQAVIPYRIVLL